MYRARQPENKGGTGRKHAQVQAPLVNEVSRTFATGVRGRPTLVVNVTARTEPKPTPLAVSTLSANSLSDALCHD